MFTPNFILLIGFFTLGIDALENTDLKQVNIQNDSGITPTPVKSFTARLIQPSGNEFMENHEEEEEDYYDGEEFQDNRLHLMLQPKKILTLNETKLRTWPSNPNISNNTPIISYRNAFAVQSSEEGETSRNELTENMSKTNKQGTWKNYEILRNFPATYGISGETLSVLRNKSEAIARTDSKQRFNEKYLLPESEKAKTETDSRYLEVDLKDVTEEKISNVTVLTGKFVASLPSSINASSPIQNETINNGETKESILALKPESQYELEDTVEKGLAQKEGIEPLIIAGNDSGDKNVQETIHHPSKLTNQTQGLENDNVYEELEPDILIEENYTDYISPNETEIDETNTVFIILPGSDQKKGNKLTETGAVPGKPYISEAISQNLLHLLMNLTAMTAVSERNGKKIMRKLEEQNGQLQSLRKQSDNIYNYIINNKMVNQINNGQAK